MTIAFWILAAVLAWALWRLWEQNRVVRQISASIRDKHSFLRETDRGLLHQAHWKEFYEAVNALIEERNHLSADRAEQEGQLQAALRNMQEAVLIADGRHRIVLANEALRKMFPSWHAETGGRLDTVLPGSALDDYVQRIQEGQETGREEIRFRDKDQVIFAEVTGSLIPGSDAENPLFLIVLHDITQLRRLESIRREFVANVSHELRTPLSMIKGYVETLVDPETPVTEAERTRFLQIIRKHADRLHALLEDILELSRLEGKDPERNFQPTILDHLVRELADGARDALARKRQELTLDLEAGTEPVTMDASKITQVFQNLVENASKYSPEGAAIQIGTRLEEERVMAWVQDTGPGIGEKDLPHIFERFYRVEKGRSREKGGTGLGLSIVKHIVQLHDGEVWAKSKLGKGTRICFSFPRDLAGDNRSGAEKLES